MKIGQYPIRILRFPVLKFDLEGQVKKTELIQFCVIPAVQLTPIDQLIPIDSIDFERNHFYRIFYRWRRRQTHGHKRG